MAIREEYQQLEAEIKKEEERSRTLDLISVGIVTQNDNYLYFATHAYKKEGLYVDDVFEEICTKTEDIIEIFEKRDKEFNINDFCLPDDIIINNLESIRFADRAPKLLKTIIALIDKLFNKLNSVKKCKREEAELLKRISNTKVQCEQLLLLYKEAVSNKTLFSIDDIQEYKAHFFYEQFNENKLNNRIKRVEAKQRKILSQEERNDYCDSIRNRLLYENIIRPFITLVVYLFFLDDKSNYRPIVLKFINELPIKISSKDSDTTGFAVPNHTINEVFQLLTKYPEQLITNVLGYFKDSGIISFLEYSQLRDAIISSNVNAFISALNDRFIEILDSYYDVIKLGYSIILYIQSQSMQEYAISADRVIRLYKNAGINIPHIAVIDYLAIGYNFNHQSVNHFLDFFSIHLWDIVVQITHFYYEYKHLLLPSDQECFSRLFSQEPNKHICDQALSEYNKLSKESILNILGFVSTIFEQNHEEAQNTQTIVEENNRVEDISKPEQHENKMIVNPFDGLNREATKQCSGDKKGYVSMFIDYLIYRGYIDAENKDAYVCCLCDEMISEDTLEHLKYNVKNKEGKSNANIVTILISRLTRYTKQNQIEVNGKVISKGSIYFNDRQIKNGELEEWCLFWPFLIGQNIEVFKKLFQSFMRSKDSKMESALKRVTSFIEDYDAAKSQNPSITKLEFIKKRH